MIIAAGLGLTMICGCTGGGGGPSKSGSATGGIVIGVNNYGCVPKPAQVPAGKTRIEVFSVTDRSSQLYLSSDNILQLEWLHLPVNQHLTAEIDLSPGQYNVDCPNSSQTQSTITVTGPSRTPGPDWSNNPRLILTQLTFQKWIGTQLDAAIADVSALNDAVQAGKVAEAKRLYAKARASFSPILFLMLGNSDLAALINSEAGSGCETSFSGFHGVERGLWVDDSVRDIKPGAKELLANMKKLKSVVMSDQLVPSDLANSVTWMLNSSSLVAAEGLEETYSHTDLVDMAGNLAGATQFTSALEEALVKLDKPLYEQLTTEQKKLTDLLKSYEMVPGYLDSGYPSYDEVTADQRSELSRAIGSYAETYVKVIRVVS